MYHELSTDERDAMVAPLRDRLVAWLTEQPEVTRADDLGDGIYGLSVQVSDKEIGVSLTVTPTE